MKQNKSSRSTVLLFLLGAALIVAALIMLVPDLLNYKQSTSVFSAFSET
jgi:sortase B